MNQLSRICVRRSLLRGNPFTRWSSKPISSNISKFHHTLNYPPRPVFTISGNNHFREFSGEAAAPAESNFGDDYLEKAISELHSEIINTRKLIPSLVRSAQLTCGPLQDKLSAIIEKLGLDNENSEDYPPHLQKFREKIQLLKENVDETVEYGKFVAASPEHEVPTWDVYKRSGEAAAECNFSYDTLVSEMCDIGCAVVRARDGIRFNRVHNLYAVKIPEDKCNALMEKLGLDKDGDYPLHLQRYRPAIQSLKESVDEIVAFREYVESGATAGESGQEAWDAFQHWYTGEEQHERIQKLSARQDAAKNRAKKNTNEVEAPRTKSYIAGVQNGNVLVRVEINPKEVLSMYCPSWHRHYILPPPLIAEWRTLGVLPAEGLD